MSRIKGSSHTLMASFLTWLILVTYILVSASAAIVPFDETVNSCPNASKTSLAICAIIFVATGTAGITWLARAWSGDRTWLLDRIQVPSLGNALAGLIGTMVAVFTNQNSDRLDTTVQVSVALELCSLVVIGVLVGAGTNRLSIRKPPVVANEDTYLLGPSRDSDGLASRRVAVCGWT